MRADGTTYVDAPPNPWADMQREEDARDLVLFTQLVEKVGEANAGMQRTGRYQLESQAQSFMTEYIVK